MPASDLAQYTPQVMTAINNAMTSYCADGIPVYHLSKIRVVAVATLFDFVRVVSSSDASHIGQNLTSIVVTLFPLFDTNDPDGHEDSIPRKEAVSLLEWMAAEETVSSFFADIPCIPITPDLMKLRSILTEKDIHLDDVRLISQQTAPETNDSVVDTQLQSKFYSQMNILSQLLSSHENKNVRKVVILHMTNLIKANRDLFHNLIENEPLESMPFMTVVHDSQSKCSWDCYCVDPIYEISTSHNSQFI